MNPFIGISKPNCMKIILTQIALIFISLTSLAQSHIEWTTHEITPGAQVNLFKGTNSDKAGNTYTIHFTQEPINHYFTYRFFAYNNTGTKLWQYDNDSCFTDCQDIYSIIVPVENDGAYFIGYYNDLTNPWQLRIKRIGLSGNLIWENYWNPGYIAAYPVSAAIDNSGNLVVALRSYFSMVNDEDFAFAKFDSTNGNNIWHYEIPDVGSQTETIRSMAIDNANNIYGCGPAGMDYYYFRVNSAGALDYKLLLTDNDSIDDFNSLGTIQLLAGNNNDLYILSGTGKKAWVQKYEASSGNYIYTKTIAHDSATLVPVSMVYDDNCLYALSNYNYLIPDSSVWPGFHVTNREYMITKVDTNGTTIWEKTFLEDLDSMALETGSGGADQMLLCNGHLYVLSTFVSDSTNANSTMMVLNNIDAAGIISWFDTDAADFGAGSMAADSYCNIYVSRSANLGSQYVHVITQKFTDNVAAIGDNNNNAVDWNIYPNPAQGFINISHESKGNFDVKVINAVGATVLNEKNKQQLNVSGLATGMYFVRLQTDSKIQVKKFIRD